MTITSHDLASLAATLRTMQENGWHLVRLSRVVGGWEARMRHPQVREWREGAEGVGA